MELLTSFMGSSRCVEVGSLSEIRLLSPDLREGFAGVELGCEVVNEIVFDISSVGVDADHEFSNCYQPIMVS
jgi:hypothetical protein